MSARTERAAEWVYNGLWRVLADWFRVPEHPPDLPSDGGEVRAFHPSRRFLGYMKFYFWIGLVLIDLALFAAWIVILVANPIVALVLAPLFLVLIIVPDVLAYIAIHLRYDTTWYVMSERSLRCRRGVWLICEHTVTFENVQDVKVRRGPIQQLFGISMIEVETAGSSEGKHDNSFAAGNRALLEGIECPDELRGLIMDRVRRSRSAGLGDEHPQLATEACWAPETLTLLREIRDETRALA